MEHRSVGRSDLKVSMIGLGTNNFNLRLDEKQSASVVRAALDLGITFFDTADIYGRRGGSEEFLGRALGSDRHKIVLSTKFGIAMDDAGLKQGGSRRYIKQAVDASLNRLGTEWIDVYHMHHDDPNTPLDETLGALDDLVRQGKIRYPACSNVSAERLVEGLATAKAKGYRGWIATQDEYSVLRPHTAHKLLKTLEEHEVGFFAFLPLAGGLLTGKYTMTGAPPPASRYARSNERNAEMLNNHNLASVQNLSAYAASCGHSVLELAMGYLISDPYVSSVIVGASTPSQLALNVAASTWRLTNQQREDVALLIR